MQKKVREERKQKTQHSCKVDKVGGVSSTLVLELSCAPHCRCFQQGIRLTLDFRNIQTEWCRDARVPRLVLGVANSAAALPKSVLSSLNVLYCQDLYYFTFSSPCNQHCLSMVAILLKDMKLYKCIEECMSYSCRRGRVKSFTFCVFLQWPKGVFNARGVQPHC